MQDDSVFPSTAKLTITLNLDESLFGVKYGVPRSVRAFEVNRHEFPSISLRD
jgi:hypothetical protein